MSHKREELPRCQHGVPTDRFHAPPTVLPCDEPAVAVWVFFDDDDKLCESPDSLYVCEKHDRIMEIEMEYVDP